jgi:hypothetical protein
VLEVFSTKHVIHSVFGEFMEFFGSVLATQVFMFLKGIGVVYSKRLHPEKLVMRGAKLLVLAYALYFFSLYIPLRI